MANQNIALNFSTNARLVGRQINSMETALEAVSKEFKKAEIGSEDFLESARAIDELTRDIKQAKSAIKAFGDEYNRTASLVATNIKSSWAKAFGQMEDISANFTATSKAQALNLRTSWGKALAEMENISRGFGNVPQPGMAPSSQLFDPRSLASLERRLGAIRDKARQIAPNTTKWQEFNREARKLERQITKINKKRCSWSFRC